MVYAMNIASRLKSKHLELVLKIAETGQLQLAAQSIAISQPAASRILADIETTIGSSLFERHPTGMVPTPSGQVFIRHARIVFTELGTMDEELAQITQGASGNVRVGAVTGPLIGYVMPAVQAMLRQNPDLRISVDVAPSASLFRGLEEAKYDFILGRTSPHSNKRDYRFHPAPSEIVSLVVHETHPLAGKEHLNLAETSQFFWTMQEEGSPIREAVETAFLRQKLQVPSRVLNSSSLLVALSQLAGADTISPQTEEVANLLTSAQIGARLVSLKLDKPILVAPYFIIQNAHRELGRAAAKLLDGVLSRI